MFFFQQLQLCWLQAVVQIYYACCEMDKHNFSLLPISRVQKLLLQRSKAKCPFKDKFGCIENKQPDTLILHIPQVSFIYFAPVPTRILNCLFSENGIVLIASLHPSSCSEQSITSCLHGAAATRTRCRYRNEIWILLLLWCWAELSTAKSTDPLWHISTENPTLTHHKYHWYSFTAKLLNQLRALNKATFEKLTSFPPIATQTLKANEFHKPPHIL